MNSIPRFKVIARHSSDHFYDTEKTWWVMDNETGERVVGFSTDPMKAGGIATVELSPDGWEAVAKDANGEIVDRVDLKTRFDQPPEGF